MKAGEEEIATAGALLVSATAVTKQRITANCELQARVALLILLSSLSTLHHVQYTSSSLLLSNALSTPRCRLFAFAARCLPYFFFAYAFFTLFGMLVGVDDTNNNTMQ